MPHCFQNMDCSLSSDSDSSDGESLKDRQYTTDLTEPADDAALLFADNEHSSEYYLRQLQNFDETICTGEDYGKGTLILLDRVEEKWSQYVHDLPFRATFPFCRFVKKDAQEEYGRLSIPILYTFLDWVLNLRRGKNGRRLPGVKCRSSLDTFWKVFRLVYERATSSKIGKPMNRQMRRV